MRTCSAEETFLQDFLKNLEEMFLRYYYLVGYEKMPRSIILQQFLVSKTLTNYIRVNIPSNHYQYYIHSDVYGMFRYFTTPYRDTRSVRVSLHTFHL